MSEIDQDLYRKIIEQGLAKFLVEACQQHGELRLNQPRLDGDVFGAAYAEHVLSDAMVKALKAYTEANN